jgi:hypothetical protein
VTKAETQQIRQTLANGLAAGTLSIEDYTAGMAVATGTSSSTSSTAPEQRNQATVVVEPSDNYKYGHVLIQKLTSTGKVQRKLYLWRSDALQVAQGILDAADALPDDVR